MAEFLFGVSNVRPTSRQRRKLERIAGKHSVTLIEATLPGIGYQRWFAAPRSYGCPVDDRLAARVAEDVRDLGPIGPRPRR